MGSLRDIRGQMDAGRGGIPTENGTGTGHGCGRQAERAGASGSINQINLNPSRNILSFYRGSRQRSVIPV